MLDETTVDGKMVAAALKLAAEYPWRQITLRAIADAAGLSLADLRDAGIADKSKVLAALLAAADRDVLINAPLPDMTQPPRDRLFEVLMARLDALEPYKSGLKSIVKAAPVDIGLVRHALASQAWMLEAAGINAEGLSGGVKAAGLATLYAQVFRVWLDDDDPGLARTMAALDRRLRRGEKTIGGLSEAVTNVRRFGDMLKSVLRPARPKRKADPVDTTAADNDPADSTKNSTETDINQSEIQFPEPPPPASP